MSVDKKIAFFLMGKKGLEVLKKFIETFGSGPVECVISARDKNVLNDYYDEIRSLCRKRNIIFFDRGQNFEIKSKYSFAISWRWMIDEPRVALIVLHDSILPRYRGYAPLVAALINGEKRIGVTALFANADFDKGNIIKQAAIDICYPIKIAGAIDRISKCYCSLVIAISKSIFNNRKIKSHSQKERRASYSLWLDGDDLEVDWNTDARHIKRFIDSVGYPYMGAASFIDGKKVRILDGEVVDDARIENRVPGKVLFLDKGCPIVVCRKGLLRLGEIIDDRTKKSLVPFRKLRVRFRRADREEMSRV